ncbi:hypothetical protein, partial [Escherichia coli]|uniref:hypothetical protein n=1 Tax=Escherichia coli TaxID=562 RepID=UPI001257DD70
QQLTHAALTTMLTRVKYPTLASICLTESHTALPFLRLFLLFFAFPRHFMVIITSIYIDRY